MQKIFKFLGLCFLVFVLLVTLSEASSVSAQSCAGGVVKKVTGCGWVGTNCGSTGGPGCSCQQTSTVDYPCDPNTCTANIDNIICGQNVNGECLAFFGNPPLQTISCGSPTCPLGATRCLTAGECAATGGSTTSTVCYQDAYTIKYNCRCPGGGGGGGSTPIPTSTPTPTPVPVAQCQNVLAYNSNWGLMTYQQLTATSVGNQLYYCASGYTNYGTFTKARFTINGTLYPDTTLVRPGSSDFCHSYTVPSGTYTFYITAEMYQSILGWVQ